MATKTLFTVEQFAALQDDKRYELDEGELIEMSSVVPKHQMILLELIGQLLAHLKKTGLGVVLIDVDCKLGENTIRRPDGLFYSAARWAAVDAEKVPIP